MTVTIRVGDCRDVLKEMEPESVQMACTSPPYWGLRNYGLPSSVWGAEPGCRHEWQAGITKGISGGTASEKVQIKGQQNFQIVPDSEHAFCQLCGAWLGTLGLEPTPEMYVEHLVEIFRLVHRVLRPNGVAFVNLGDSYNGSGGAGGDYNAGGLREGQPRYPGRNVKSLKAKDLVGIPWRVAFALQADGWWLRSDIVWAKGRDFEVGDDGYGSPMLGSPKDRPTSSHEFMFLLTKSAKYFYDNTAVEVHWEKDGKSGNHQLRDVWLINPGGYAGAQFAVMPTALVEPCIKAGTKEGDTVLDPFAGACTVGLEADRLGRDAELIELNPAYVAMGRKRIKDASPMFAEVKVI